MMPDHYEAAPVRQELASAIRAVNAKHAEAGAPELPGLTQAWLILNRDLDMAAASGDEIAARKAVDTYRVRGLRAIETVGR